MQSIAVAFMLLATTAAVRTDALADLRRALVALRGTAAIAATYDGRQTNKAHGRFFNQNLDVPRVDGVPIAAERKAQFSVGFLFLKASGGATEKWTFARRDDRLVVLRHERDTSGGGLGQNSEGTEVESIALH